MRAVCVILILCIIFASSLIKVKSMANKAAYSNTRNIKIYNPYNHNKLLNNSMRTLSDQVLLYKNGKLNFELYNLDKSTLINTMSITKSFVGLSIGFLIQDNKVGGFNDKISLYIKEWRNTNKEQITIKEVLTMTSIISNKNKIVRNSNLGDLKVNKRKVGKNNQKQSGAHDIVNESNFNYNNMSIQIIGFIVLRLTNMDIDSYIKLKLFSPLSITYKWDKDKYGNPKTDSGLYLDMYGLLKIGLLFLNNGFYKKREIIKSNILEEYTKIRIREEYIGINKKYPKSMYCSYGYLIYLCKNKISFWGYGGQYLIIDKKNRCIGVRLKDLNFFADKKYNHKNIINDYMSDRLNIKFNNFISYVK